MSDYKRLREKMFEDRQTYIDENGDYWAVGNMDNFTGAVKGVAIDKLAALEDKIEKGTLIELPCKVGTIVYQICKNCSKCPHFKEVGWEYDCWCDLDSEVIKTMFEFDGDRDCVYLIEELEFTYEHIKDFGKDLFLTKAEAEAKLEQIGKEK